MILPQLLGWNIKQNDDFFIMFLVATHLATAIVLFFFFLSDWMKILRGLGRSLRAREIGDDPYARLGWLLVIGTIPAGLLGLLLEHALRDLFASAQSAAFFLMVNGVMLYGAERLRRRAPVVDSSEDAVGSDVRIGETVSWRSALGIGGAQALALIPGLSRSGATMGGGLLVGLSNEDAARFAFLLATPIIGAAALLKLPDLVGSAGNGVRGPALVGALCSAFTRLHLGPVPGPLLRDQPAHAVRDLLRAGGCGRIRVARGDVMAVAVLHRWWATLVRRRTAIALAVAGVVTLVWLLTADDLNGILGPGS